MILSAAPPVQDARMFSDSLYRAPAPATGSASGSPAELDAAAERLDDETGSAA